MAVPEGDDASTKEAIEKEIAFLKGTPSPPLFDEPMLESQAAEKIKAFTETWQDPFSPSYGFINPWATKKEGKGKKERKGEPVRPTAKS